MRLTKSKLKQIIKEELTKVIKEAYGPNGGRSPWGRKPEVPWIPPREAPARRPRPSVHRGPPPVYREPDPGGEEDPRGSWDAPDPTSLREEEKEYRTDPLTDEDIPELIDIINTAAEKNRAGLGGGFTHNFAIMLKFGFSGHGASALAWRVGKWIEDLVARGKVNLVQKTYGRSETPHWVFPEGED